MKNKGNGVREVATARPYLKTSIKLKNGLHPIKLRVYHDNTSYSYSIKLKRYNGVEFKGVDKEGFEDIMKHDNRGQNRSWRLDIQKEVERAEEIIKELGEDFTFPDFKSKWSNKAKVKHTLESLFVAKIDERTKAKKLSTATSYKATMVSLKKFDNKVSLKSFSVSYLKRYESWLVDTELNSYTTVGIYMRNLRHILNNAKRLGLKVSVPFGKGEYEIPESNSKKKALEKDELKSLFKYTPESEQELKAYSYWILSYLCSGMNMRDIAFLKNENFDGDSFKFYRQKTINTVKKKEKIQIDLIPDIKELIDRLRVESAEASDFVFPILKKGADLVENEKRLKQHIKTTNKYMGKISQKLGFSQKLTTYWARHSFGTTLKNLGVPESFIKEQFGHKSLATTQAYLASFESEDRKTFTKGLLLKSKD